MTDQVQLQKYNFNFPLIDTEMPSVFSLYKERGRERYMKTLIRCDFVMD